MKKILLLLILLAFSIQFCLADGTDEENIDVYFTEEPAQTTQLNGYLEYNQNAEQQEESQAQTKEQIEEAEAIHLVPTESAQIDFTKPKSFGSKSLISTSRKPTFHPIQEELVTPSKFSTPEYNIRPVSTSYSKKFGKLSVGTTYGSSLSSARENYSTGVFTKYEGKHFAVSTAFAKNTNSNYDSYSDSFSLAPELKITKRLSLLDVMQTDINQINKSNQIVLRYTPHFKKYADDIQFEVGAGQSFYQDTYIDSSVHFSTKFKL